MKRDMDLVRLILLAVESGPALAPDSIDIDGYEPEEIAYHLLIMGEANLMVVLEETTMTEIGAVPVRMTWAGHEFLETIRDDARWRSVKTQTEKAGGLVFEVIKAVASATMLRQLGL